MKGHRGRNATLATAALLLGAVAAGAAVREERLEREFDLDPGGRVTLQNVNGSVDLVGWSRPEVRLEATKRVRGVGNADELLEAIEIAIAADEREIAIETRFPRSGAGLWDWLRGVRGSASVDYRLWLPTGVVLEVVTVNGTIAGEDLDGDLDLRTTNGSTTVRNAAGRASVVTTNGAIKVELERVDPGADLAFSTTNGSIRLALPSDIAATLSARTTNGSIDSDFPVTVTGRVRRNELRGELNGGGGELRLRTTNGAIRIRAL